MHTMLCLAFGYCRVRICDRHDKRPSIMCVVMHHPLSMKTQTERIRDELKEGMR